MPIIQVWTTTANVQLHIEINGEELELSFDGNSEKYRAGLDLLNQLAFPVNGKRINFTGGYIESTSIELREERNGVRWVRQGLHIITLDQGGKYEVEAWRSVYQAAQNVLKNM